MSQQLSKTFGEICHHTVITTPDTRTRNLCVSFTTVVIALSVRWYMCSCSGPTRQNGYGLHVRHYSQVTTTKPPPVCTKTFSASLTKLTDLLPQSRDNRCYVIRRILAPPPLCLQKPSDLRAYDFAYCPDLWHEPRLAKTCIWSWRLRGITPAIYAGIKIIYLSNYNSEPIKIYKYRQNTTKFIILYHF